MNYILEDGIDFYKELNDNTELENVDDICLISHEPLIRQQTVKLLCGHKFNYVPLFNEVYNQKKCLNVLEVKRLSINQIKCPYCRNVQNKVLPYISDISGIKRVYGVNSPDKWEMKNYLCNCNYVYKSGKKKGQECGKRSLEEKCVFHSKISTPIDSSSICQNTLNKYTVNQLRNICKIMKLKGYSKLKKCQLLELIQNDLNKD